MGKRRCRASFPKISVLLFIVKKLKSAYPQDPIEVVDLGALQAAIASAKSVFRYCRAKSCRYRILLAGAKLFEEIVLRHPLIDGNKRLATVALYIFLRKNRFPRSTTRMCITEDLAIKVALGKLRYRGVARWLRRCLERA